ncbi:MAG: hypothetical protein AAGA43_13360 [Bacteroidota bacterium]
MREKFVLFFYDLINEIASWSHSKAVDVVYGISIFLLVVFAFILRIPAVKEFLGFEQPYTNLLLSIGAFLVITFSLILWKLTSRTNLLIEKLDDSILEYDNKLFFVGTNGIYKEVNKEMRKRKMLKEKVTVSIIGYTLFSVEPQLKSWKKDGILNNIEINLCHLDFDFIKDNSNIDPLWPQRLELHLKWIEDFKTKNSEFLKKFNVSINLYPYSHLPCVHGFKLNNGSMFVAFASWENGQIMQPNNSTFVHLEPKDYSKATEELRSLFNNWLDRSKSYTRG